MKPLPMIATFLIPTLLLAQGPASKPSENSAVGSTAVLTLKEFMSDSLKYSPDLKGAESKVRAAEETSDKTRGSIYPTVSAYGSAVNRQLVGTPTTPGVQGDYYTAGLQLSQPIYVGGAITSGLDFYKASEEIAKQGVFTVKQQVLLNVITTYYNLAQAEQLLERALENQNVLKSYVDITGHYRSIGRSRQTDFLQAGVNFSLAKVDVNTAQNNLRLAQASAEKLLGFDGRMSVKSNLQLETPSMGNLSVDKAFETALENNPTLKALQKTADQVDSAKDIDLATDFPSLYLNASTGVASPDKSSLLDGPSKVYSVGLNLTIPIFSGLTSISKRHIYSEQKTQAIKAYESARDTIRNGIESSLATLKSLESQLELAKSSVKEGRSALEMANKEYRNGTTSATDVVNLQATRYNAEKLFVNTQFSYMNALVNLKNYMGIDLEKAFEVSNGISN